MPPSLPWGGSGDIPKICFYYSARLVACQHFFGRKPNKAPQRGALLDIYKLSTSYIYILQADSQLVSLISIIHERNVESRTFWRKIKKSCGKLQNSEKNGFLRQFLRKNCGKLQIFAKITKSSRFCPCNFDKSAI